MQVHLEAGLAQQLLKESGYDGTPVVMMKPTDLASIQKLPDVAAQLLRQAGFKVDLQAMDWQTLVGRRAKKDAPDKGGWHLFMTAWNALDVWSPITNVAYDARGERSVWFGWPSDEKMVELRNRFMRESDEAGKLKVAQAINVRAFEQALYAPLGDAVTNLAARKSVEGLFVSNNQVYWNLSKR